MRKKVIIKGFSTKQFKESRVTTQKKSMDYYWLSKYEILETAVDVQSAEENQCHHWNRKRFHRSLDAERQATQRAAETFEQTQTRHNLDADLHAAQRAAETSQQTQARQVLDAERHAAKRDAETSQQTQARQVLDAERNAAQRETYVYDEGFADAAFDYDPLIDYFKQCHICKAMLSNICHEQVTSYPTEFPNSLELSGVPSHKLRLKIGVPVLLMRNLEAPRLCNGTRLQIKQLGRNTIRAIIMTGMAKDEEILTPRIPMIPTELPFQFKRIQFPLKPAFAMTINKAQGQTLKVAGVNLKKNCFSHGQLYVVCSRCAACVLAGMTSWDLDAQVLADVHRGRVEARERGERPVPADLRQALRRWDEALAHVSAGHRTIEAIRPVLEEWVLTGHGCFGHYLYRVARREETPQCHHCGAPDDTAEHILLECLAWRQRQQRCDLIAALGGGTLSLRSMVEAMLRSESAWEAAASFCENVISQKEAAEREREDDPLAAPSRRRRAGRRGRVHALATPLAGTAQCALPVTWAPNEPDNYKNNEDCTIMLQNGTLADVRCNDTYPYICYKKKTDDNPLLTPCGTIDKEYVLDTSTGSCYKFHTTGHNWRRAYMTCMAEGGYLAIINSAAEAQIMANIFAKYPSSKITAAHKDIAAIGFYSWGEHGNWYTVQGESLQKAGYSTFENGQPDNHKAYENGSLCGGVFRSGHLDDVWCNSASFPFICEKKPGSLIPEDN
ncbi:hypothetical protein evm_014558 [Chilo suppressalis]|nr:hypothetical protein evm_014558 [Chilo suppressalis]